MKCLEDKDDTFGSLKPTCILYNRMTRLQLEHVLTKNNLRGSRFQRPYLFFDELLDKLYFEMERASDKTLGVKPRVFILSHTHTRTHTHTHTHTLSLSLSLSLSLALSLSHASMNLPATHTSITSSSSGCDIRRRVVNGGG